LKALSLGEGFGGWMGGRRRRLRVVVRWAAKVWGEERVETVKETVVGVGRLVVSILLEALGDWVVGSYV
jgi:hypothetical protein